MILGIPKRLFLIIAFLLGVVVIYVLGGNEGTSEGAEGGEASHGCRVSVTADVLNVRAGPGTDATVVGQLERDAEADAATVVRNGYHKLAEGRWASDEFLEPVRGARCG